MRKVLIVGCGGSGAETLAFMMDQLKTMLAEKLPEKFPTPKDVRLPAAWQFVSVDVPTAPEKPGRNLASVADAGGHYISCGSTSSYAAVDSAVSTNFASKRALGNIASWAIREPASETTPITDGAGQYRAIGRMLFLSKAREVQTRLEKAWNELFKPSTEEELTQLYSELTGKTNYDSDFAKARPLVFVVTSMAGGAGASMALDVCRLLTSLEGNITSLNALFAVTPDIFTSTVHEDMRLGMNPNALAMFAELAAAQFGSAAETDRQTFADLGINVGADAMPVGRVFPVGAHSGVDGRQLGDGKAKTVYRSLGRGLAALLMDESALKNFTAYRLTNKGGLPLVDNTYGWGVSAAQANDIPWGTYGYAQLSLGRDRYAEYAAQRLARVTVNKILNGHMDPEDSATGDVQIARLVENNMQVFYTELNKIVPAPGSMPHAWVSNYFGRAIDAWVEKQKNSLAVQIDNGLGKRGNEWAADVQNVVNAFNGQLQVEDYSALITAVHEWGLPGANSLQEGFLRIIRGEMAKHGVPYGAAVLRHLGGLIKNNLIGALENLRNLDSRVSVPQSINSLERGKLTDTSQLINELVSDAATPIRNKAVAIVGHAMAEALMDFVPGFIDPLQKNIMDQLHEVEITSSYTTDPHLGIAQLKTDVPNLWPEESELVADRFSQAANEVFLTDVSEFPRQYESDLIQAVAKDGEMIDYTSARNKASTYVLQGEWEALAGAVQAPCDLLTTTEPWVSRSMIRTPGNPEVRVPHSARFSFRIGTGQVLDRSREFINRRGSSFELFIRTSLREYVNTPSISESERNERRRSVIGKFKLAMDNALPLTQVDDKLVKKLYGTEVTYNFTFSKIPFGNDPLGEELQASVAKYAHFQSADPTRPLGDALVSQGEERAIDIFGAYPNYVPIVQSSLFDPIRAQWQKTGGSRTGFWKDRRARQLPGALPMSDAERKAMIAGWYVGRIVGRVIFPTTLDIADDVEVQICDSETQQWLRFETPMLTPPSRMRRVHDWLPSVLESASIAWAAAGESPLLGSMRPYVELRKLFDAAPQPTEGGRTFHGQRLLREWIFTGERPAQELNQIPGVDASSTPEQRKDAAIAWLERQRNIAEDFVPTRILQRGHLSSYETRQWADIDNRELAKQLPVFIDIAPDIYDMLGQLIHIVEAAYKQGNPAQDNPYRTTSIAPVQTTFSMPGDEDI